jgi:serine/threonine protein phosphatase PrpC
MCSHAFLVIASDGVFEFISSQRVVDMVSQAIRTKPACPVYLLCLQ